MVQLQAVYHLKRLHAAYAPQRAGIDISNTIPEISIQPYFSFKKKIKKIIQFKRIDN